MPYFLIAFSNTHTAILTQKILTGTVNFCIMPTLRELSQSCGISIRINSDELSKKATPEESALPIVELMKAHKISSTLYQIYYIEDDSLTPLTFLQNE